MDQTLQMILQILQLLIIILSSVSIIVVAFKKIVKASSGEEVLSILQELCQSAENLYGADENTAKFTSVVSQIYDILPTVYKLAYSLKDIQSMITQIIHSDTFVSKEAQLEAAASETVTSDSTVKDTAVVSGTESDTSLGATSNNTTISST